MRDILRAIVGKHVLLTFVIPGSYLSVAGEVDSQRSQAEAEGLMTMMVGVESVEAAVVMGCL